MQRTYKISTIKEAISIMEKKNPEQKRIKIDDLVQQLNKLRTPEIYNLDHLISSLRKYIIQNQSSGRYLYKESEVCEILNVTKLTLHKWRQAKLISYKILPPKTIRYLLPELLHNFEYYKSKNISNY